MSILLAVTQEQFDNWVQFQKETKNINGGFRNIIPQARRQQVVAEFQQNGGRQKPIIRELKMGAATVRRILQEEGVIA